MEFNKQNIFNKVKTATQSTVVMDEGLRAYMLKVYNYMATGVLLTGIIALLSFKMSVVTDASGAIAGFTSFGNTLFFFRIEMGCDVSTSWNSFLYEFWN